MFYTRHKSQTYILHSKLVYNLISNIITVLWMFTMVLILLNALPTLPQSQPCHEGPIFLSAKNKRPVRFFKTLVYSVLILFILVC